MEAPTTPEEWWENLTETKDAMRDLVAEFHPKSGAPRRPMKITAPQAENLTEQIRGEIMIEPPYDPLEVFDASFQKKDHLEMIRVLDAAYWGIPESLEAHQLKGFYVLCDLCSETWVFNDHPDD